MYRIVLLTFLALSHPAHSHSPHHGNEDVTSAENEWMDRQFSIDGSKCCDRLDVSIGRNVIWRIVNGNYQVYVEDKWWDIPPGRVMREIEDDPSPFGQEALLFYSTPILSVRRIWCFRPEPLM